MEIADKIYDIINSALEVEYISDFTLEIDEDEWKLSLDLNQKEASLTIIYQGTENGFYDFLYKELRSRQLDRTRYFTGEMTDPAVENNYVIFDYEL